MKFKLVNNYKAVINTHANKLPILYKSVLVGIVAGIVVSGYRMTLTAAEEISIELYSLLRENINYAPVTFIALALAGYGIGVLVSKNSMISGSGIPQVSGIIQGYFQHSWIKTLLAKYFGGAISILAGLSLGREGPSIQLGACVAEGIGDKLASSRTEKKILIASGASAGLAAAFNAPLAGAMFAVEEIFKYFSPVILLSTMISAMVADFVSKIFFGMSSVFSFNLEGTIQLKDYWLLFLLGGILGLSGAIYNFSLLKIQRLYRINSLLTQKRRIIIPFIIAGGIGIFFPIALGGGHQIIENLQDSSSLKFLLVLLVVKFLFSILSFGSGAPGGIFFPLLILGAIIGTIYANVAVSFLGADPLYFGNWIVLAMAGYFSAIVRAPITGILLLVEMTGSLNHMLPLAVVSIIAYIVADLLKSKPIYDAMLENLIREGKSRGFNEGKGKRVTIETIVQHGSSAENKMVKEIDIPQNSLLIAVRRHGHDIIPKGDTMINAQDYLILLVSTDEEAQVREILNKLTKGF